MANMPRLVVEVFEHVNFRGRKVTLIDSIPNTTEIGAQDVISSIKIYKGPGFSASPNYKAIFHEHVNYQGRRLVFWHLGSTQTSTIYRTILGMR